MGKNIEFLNIAKSALIYDGYKFSKGNDNKSQSARWKCSTCQRVSITIKDGLVVTDNTHKTHADKCIRMTALDIECYIKHEELKHLSKGKRSFLFKKKPFFSNSFVANTLYLTFLWVTFWCIW